MARDKRGQTPEPTVDDGLDDMTDPGTGESFVAGPTSRNEARQHEARGGEGHRQHEALRKRSIPI